MVKNPIRWLKERKQRKLDEEQAYYEEQEKQRKAAETPPLPLELPDDIELETEIEYGYKVIHYNIKVTNKTGNPLGKIVVMAGINPKLAKFESNEAECEMLDHKESADLNFNIIPNYTSGKSPVKGQISYFDFARNDRLIFPIEPKVVSFKMGKVTPVEVDEIEWRFKMAELIKTEAESSELNVPPAILFEKLSATIEGIGFHAVDPLITDHIYRAIGRFMGENKRGEMFAVQLQIIGQDDLSKFLLEAYAEDGQKAHSMCYHIIDRIEEYAHCRENLVRAVPKHDDDDEPPKEEEPEEEENKE